MNRRILGFVTLVMAGMAIGIVLSGTNLLDFFGRSTGSEQDETGQEKEVLYWVAPMDPNFRSDKPGKSPMGMDLIPFYGDEETQRDAAIVRINPAVVNNLGVRTAEAKLVSIHPVIRTVGRITFDERLTTHIHLRAEGWIEKLYVRAVGEPVEEGDLLFEVYSPALVNAQAEFVQALSTGRASLISAARDRLSALGVSDGQIATVEKMRKPAQYTMVFAPRSGIVAALDGADGMFVAPNTEIMSIADLSEVWLVADVFEADIELVAIGAEVEGRSPFGSGPTVRGTVDYVYPDLNMTTRTAPVRVVLPNPDSALKPGMFMSVEIEGRQRPETTVIPREALIRTGREERVILALGNGMFRPALVTSGLEAGGEIEILSGLNPGETVVTSGQFLIDSESSFAGASLRLQPGDGEAANRMPTEADGIEMPEGLDGPEHGHGPETTQ